MRNLLRVIGRRAGLAAGACVLLAGGTGAGVLSGTGTAQAAACTGAGVTAGTTCTDTGTLALAAGTLTLTPPTALAWAGTVTGVDQQLVDATPADQAYTVDDATGSGTGWNVTVSATTFTSTTSAATLPDTGTFATNGSLTSAAAAAAPTAACRAASTCTLPTNTTTYPVAITTAAADPTAFEVFNAAAATGLGSIDIGLPGANPVGWWLAVPGNAAPATYTSTVTLEVISAP
jgi:WxL domain surface cell wall-binding